VREDWLHFVDSEDAVGLEGLEEGPMDPGVGFIFSLAGKR